MGSVETYRNKLFVPKRDYQGYVVHADGELDFGRWYNVGARKQVTTDDLSEVHGGLNIVVLSEVTDERVMISGGIRELLATEAQVILHGDMAAPTVVNYTRMRCKKLFGRQLYGTNLYRFPLRAGIPQAHNTTYFPAPTGVSGAAEGSGTIPDNTYYAWVVPYYRNFDPVYGAAASGFTVANWQNLLRTRDFIFGTPSSSATVVMASGPQGMKVDWTEPSPGDLYGRPTGYVVVLGTVESITDASSKIYAIAAYGTATATITALDSGAQAFGTTPAVADLRVLQTCTVVADTRVWTSEAEGTDWTWDGETGTAVRKAGGDVSDGMPTRLIYWVRQPATTSIDVGAGAVSSSYHHVRLENWRADGTDPDTRMARGIIVDLPRVNLAGLNIDLLSQNPDGFHRPLTFNDLLAEYDTASGYTARVYSVAHEHLNMLDYMSDDISAAAA